MDQTSQKLKSIATFIMSVYAPMRFCKKNLNSNCKDGAKHIFQWISRPRYLPKDLKEIVDPFIQRKSYFANPENIIAMITDDRQHVRELKLRKILKARNISIARSVQQFRLPTLNFASADYTEMIDWSAENIAEPPVQQYFRKRIGEVPQTQKHTCRWIKKLPMSYPSC